VDIDICFETELLLLLLLLLLFTNILFVSSSLRAILRQQFTIRDTYDDLPGLIESSYRNESLWKKDIRASAGGFYFKLPKEVTV
jgi:hypothetical protein